MVLAPSWKRYALDIVRRMKAAQEHDDRNDAIYGWRGHRLYCPHGTYVGDPYGPDYMCGVCENGTSIYEYALDRAYSHQRDATHKFRQDAVLAIIRSIPSENGQTLITEDEIKRVADLVCAISNSKTMSVAE